MSTVLSQNNTEKCNLNKHNVATRRNVGVTLRAEKMNPYAGDGRPTGRLTDERFLKINHKNGLTEQQEQENKTDNLTKN